MTTEPRLRGAPGAGIVKTDAMPGCPRRRILIRFPTVHLPSNAVPFAILFSATLTLLALLSPVAVLVALVRAALPRTRAHGLHLLAWEAAGGVLAALVLAVVNLLRYRQLAAIFLDALALAFAAGITVGAAAYAVRWLRHRRGGRRVAGASPSSE